MTSSKTWVRSSPSSSKTRPPSSPTLSPKPNRPLLSPRTTLPPRLSTRSPSPSMGSLMKTMNSWSSPAKERSRKLMRVTCRTRSECPLQTQRTLQIKFCGSSSAVSRLPRRIHWWWTKMWVRCSTCWMRSILTRKSCRKYHLRGSPMRSKAWDLWFGEFYLITCL